MAKYSVSYIYQIIDKYSAPLSRIKRATKKAGRSAREASISFKKLGKSMVGVGVKAAAALTLPIVMIGKSAIKAASQLESMRISFDVMLGSAEKGQTMMNDLSKFSASTPFQLLGIAQSTKQLLAAGVAQEDIIDRLTVIGDIAAGANVPINEMAAIFSKSRQKGKLMSEEILQFAERGVPLLDMLAKNMGKTKNEIFEMASKGKITFEIALKAMRDMTSESGVFNNMMAKQSSTMAGLFSTLKDNIFLANASVGQTIIKMFELKKVMLKAIEAVQRFNDKFSAFAENNPKITKTIILLLAVAAAAAPILIVLGSVIAMIPLLVAGFTAMGAAIPFVAVGAMIVLAYKLGNIIGQLAIIFAVRLWGAIKNTFDAAKVIIGDFFGWFVGIYDSIVSKIASVGNTIAKIKNLNPFGKGEEKDVNVKSNLAVQNAVNNNTSINGNISVTANGATVDKADIRGGSGRNNTGKNIASTGAR